MKALKKMFGKSVLWSCLTVSLILGGALALWAGDKFCEVSYGSCFGKMSGCDDCWLEIGYNGIPVLHGVNCAECGGHCYGIPIPCEPAN